MNSVPRNCGRTSACCAYITGYRGSTRDVSAQRRAEQAVRESEARLQDFLANATDLIHSTSPEGSFVYTNRAWRETLGYSEEEVALLNMFDVIHPDDVKHVQPSQRYAAVRPRR